MRPGVLLENLLKTLSFEELDGGSDGVECLQIVSQGQVRMEGGRDDEASY